MYLLVADETNKNPGGASKFLMYGGLILDLAKLPLLNADLERIRADAGYESDDELKFDTRARPGHVSREAATTAKKKVIEVCVARGARLIVQASSHELIKTQDEERRLTFAANTIIAAYHQFLTDVDDTGICILDTPPIKRPGAFLAEKFMRGLIFPNGGVRRLSRISLFGTSCMNASHVNSAVDILLGTFRYCVNEPPQDGPAKEMLASLIPVMHHKIISGRRRITEYGLLFRPKVLQMDAHRDDYDDLRARLNRLAGAHLAVG